MSAPAAIAWAVVRDRTSPVVTSGALTWPRVVEHLTTHNVGDKDGPGFLPAAIEPGPRKGDRVARVDLLVLDAEAQAEAAKADDGREGKRVTGPLPPTLDAMAAELELWGLAGVLSTSHSHEAPALDGGTLGPRYRLALPLSRPLKPDEVRPLAEAAAAMLGIAQCVDRGCFEPARLFYLPRCPAERRHLAQAREVQGRPLDVDALLKAAAAPKAAPKRTTGPRGASVIDAFNEAHDLGAILAKHGYEPAGTGRYRWPGSTTGVAGVVVFPDSGRCFSHHAADPLHCEHGRDAFDAWCVLEHGGDVSAAVREAARILGMDGPQGPSVGASKADKHRAGAPLPLPAELEPVEPFPLAALPDAFRPWVGDVADRMQCPADFVAVPMMVAAASLVARRAAIRPQERTDWVERGNLWALLVGRPGMMKSPAMAEALAPINRLEAQAAEGFTETMRRHQIEAQARKLRDEQRQKEARARLKSDIGADVSDLLASSDGAPDPVRPRYIVQDATYEKLGAILAENPDGVLSVRDEMRALFLHLAREESAQARGFYLQAWSGGRYVFDRIERGTVVIPDARLSIIGTIQPGPLADLMQQARKGSADDGMLERFLIAWPDSGGEWREVDRWPDSAARRAAWEAFDRLDALGGAAAAGGALQDVRFAPDAREAFAEWRAELERKLREAEADGLEGALSKFRHHVPALALTLHVIDGGIGAPVSLAATLRALALAEYFESHARRLYGSARRLVVRGARLIIDKARAGALPDPFTGRDVYRNNWAGLGDRQIVADALDLLVAHEWLAEANVETGGRPTAAYSLTEGARRG